MISDVLQRVAHTTVRQSDSTLVGSSGFLASISGTLPQLCRLRAHCRLCARRHVVVVSRTPWRLTGLIRNELKREIYWIKKNKENNKVRKVQLAAWPRDLSVIIDIVTYSHRDTRVHVQLQRDIELTNINIKGSFIKNDVDTQTKLKAEGSR